MPWTRPTPREVWRAIDAYLAAAYDGPPPPPVVERLARLRASREADFLDCDAFESVDGDRYAVRLGNRFYPHMKLVVEASPAGGVLFRVDTHDRHFLDLVGPPPAALDELMRRNQEIARAIQEAWSASSVPTLREYWRGQMARRRGEPH